MFCGFNTRASRKDENRFCQDLALKMDCLTCGDERACALDPLE